MTQVRLIGDIHGDIQTYADIISDCERSIQVGDFGIGFIRRPLDFGMKHEFIRGNHDDPEACKRIANFIPDGTIRNDVMFVGGAYSIDWAYRTEGISWWSGEECSTEQLNHFVATYDEVQPKAMITHELPDKIADIMCIDMGWKKYDLPSRTRDAFQAMYELHQPDYWIAGHWHLSWRKKVGNTEFIVLNINEYMDIDLPL